MGLAASQARFLAITSRKMNCEFESMQIAQQKLSVTRDQQVAAQEYQNSLSATKLVWDADNNCDGTGDIYNLSYGLMMTPSALNEYDPYLVTDTRGRIVLSDSMFQAALDAGIIDKNGDPVAKNADGTKRQLLVSGGFEPVYDPADIDKSDPTKIKIKAGAVPTGYKMSGATDDGSRNAFLYQLGVQNVADVSTIESIFNLGTSGYTKSGVGGEIIDKTLTNAMTTNTFITYMKNAKDADGNSIYALNLASLFADADNNGKITDDEFNAKFCTTVSPSDIDKDSASGGTKDKLIITKSGNPLSKAEIEKLTLGDLLSGKYEMTGMMDATGMSAIAEKVLAKMAESFGLGENTNVKGLNVDAASQSALQQAYEFSKLQLNANYAQDTKGNTNYAAVSSAINSADNTNVIAKSNKNVSSVSLTNMLKSFLTNFTVALDGYDAGYNVDKTSVKGSKYVTDDLTYYFVLKNDNAMTEQSSLNADFYNMLYNQICMNGACSDKNIQEMVKDPTYLNNALKNGQLFISSLNTDGYFYQGHYTASGHIAEVTDDDAIAQAEAEYNVKKSKLNYKEESLELKMKNIDTELSALTTEYDTVKNLISKNVEKVFTMFSS